MLRCVVHDLLAIRYCQRTAPRPVTNARRFIKPLDPPQCGGPVGAVRQLPMLLVCRPLAPSATQRGPGTSPNTPAGGPSMPGHNQAPGTVGMVLESPAR